MAARITNRLRRYADNDHLQAVPVIAVFQQNGKLLPLYVSYQGLRLKVDHIPWMREDTYSRRNFACQMTLSDRTIEMILHYDATDSIWLMESIRDLKR